jgi:hypothetical protein
LVREWTLERGDRVLYQAQTTKRWNCPGIDSRAMVHCTTDSILGKIHGEELTEDEMRLLPMPQPHFPDAALHLATPY